MFTAEQLRNIMFVDIETASMTESYESLDERFARLWDKKSESLNRREEEPRSPSEWYGERAAIFAEFGKVVCISAGFLTGEDERMSLRIKSFYGEDEAAILRDFAEMLTSFHGKPGRSLCAHNGKEFDFPYLGRRYLIHGLPLPPFIDGMQGKKPWEIALVDTMTLWKFGDFKSFVSLDLLTAVLNIPSPKDDIDGSEVGRVFWQEKDSARIARYCEKDVVATAQVMLRYSGLPILTESDVQSVTAF